MLYLSVDSIDKKIVTCEDDNRNKWEISIENLPPNIREGDVILLKNDGSFVVDDEEKSSRQNTAALLLNKILNSNNKKF